jgi:hypothetical protein
MAKRHGDLLQAGHVSNEKSRKPWRINGMDFFKLDILRHFCHPEEKLPETGSEWRGGG